LLDLKIADLCIKIKGKTYQKIKEKNDGSP
jgi:hypothetical protein